MGRLVINGDEIYELDEECLKEKQNASGRRTGERGWMMKEDKRREKNENGCGRNFRAQPER